MYSMYRYALLAFPLIMMACGSGGSMQATITDHADALTDAGGDLLFDVVIDSADQTYPLAELEVTITPEGGAAVVAEVELFNDADADGAVGAGDTLRAIEPATNAFGASDAGSDMAVSISHKPADGEAVELYSGTWSAN